MNEKLITDKQVQNKTVLSFTVFILFLALCFFAWRWLQMQPKKENALQPLRKVLYMNEDVFSRLYSFNNLSKKYKKDDVVKKVRLNGKDGLSDNFNAAAWKLNIIRNGADTLQLTLAEIKALPKTEIIFDFKCIEGWSQVTHWGGVRFSDLVKKYNLNAEAQMAYTGLETPDKKYYVGIDNKSMLHPQTLLCYEMNGKALEPGHGYPLRLIIPVKYGVKHLKRIGTIFFSDARPRDFWFEQGYDYYCGL
ncbi:MAG: molybdopterin-dependent oxidoreductase [Ferruginibacter sp.]